jgi:hypothetical protein
MAARFYENFHRPSYRLNSISLILSIVLNLWNPTSPLLKICEGDLDLAEYRLPDVSP